MINPLDSSQPAVWDEAGFMARICNKEILAQKLVKLFYKSCDESITELQNLLEDGDATEAGNCAHKIKGMAGNVGADALAEVCQIIETSGKTGDIASQKAQINEINHQYHLVTQELSKKYQH